MNRTKPENFMDLFPNSKQHMEYIYMNNLHSNLYYQNEPSKENVKKIVDRFHPIALDPLVVSRRDNRNNVVDGQTRLCAAKQVYENSKYPIKISCRVIEGLTEIEENLLFDILAGRRTVGIEEKTKAKYGAKDENTVNMVDLINESGLVFDFGSGKAQGRIKAIKTIEEIYSKLDTYDFKAYLKLLKDTWEGNTDSLKRFMLYGLFEFYNKFKDKIDNKTFVKKLSRYAPNDIEKMGKSDLSASGNTGYAKALVKLYNKGLKEENRIGEWY